MANTLLIIEDEPLLKDELSRHFEQLAWEVFAVDSLAAARNLLVTEDLRPLVVLSDMSLPDGNALDLLEEVNGTTDNGEWIFLTAYGGIRDSVRALRLGAVDFLEKPCDLDRLDLVVTSARRSARAQRRLRDQARVQTERYSPESFVGGSRSAREVREMLVKLTQVPFSALMITGETGTGKGIAARILHHSGPRSGGPLVEVNCAALPAELLESELFGHEAGAFTGAKGRRRGLVEQAAGGTLFLDEVAEIDTALQAKLLKAIEDRVIRRVGGEREVQVDVQIIAASNRELQKRVEDKTFRSDLYHRLTAFRLHLPPLRERREDLDDLVPLFVADLNAAAGRAVRIIPPPVWRRLKAHDWPGNVRELRNVVERCVLFADHEVFPERWLQLEATGGSGSGVFVEEQRICLPLDGTMPLDDMERHIIATALERHAYNVMATARALGTTRETLRYRIQKHGLKPSR